MSQVMSHTARGTFVVVVVVVVYVLVCLFVCNRNSPGSSGRS